MLHFPKSTTTTTSSLKIQIFQLQQIKLKFSKDVNHPSNIINSTTFLQLQNEEEVVMLLQRIQSLPNMQLLYDNNSKDFGSSSK